MRIAYISGPLRAFRDNGNDNPYIPYEMEQNTILAWRVARKLWERSDISFVLCPHMNTRGMDGPEDTNPDFIGGDLEFIRRMGVADVMVMLPGWERSEGSLMEKALAERRGIPIEIWEED